MTRIQYKDKTIDLQPYFEGFPYLRFLFSDKDNHLYYLHRTATLELWRVPLSADPDFSKGRKISELDFGAFNAWHWEYHSESGSFLFLGDEKNDEVLNIYQFDIEKGTKERLTGEQYIYGYDVHDGGRSIYFLGRAKEGEAYRTTLKKLDWRDRKMTELCSDTAELSFSWGEIIHHKRTGAVFFIGQHDNDRNRRNIIMLDPHQKKTRPVLDSGIRRSDCSLFREWLDDDTFLYEADDDGFINIYSFNVVTEKSRQITFFKNPVGSARLVHCDGKPYVFVSIDFPVADQLLLISPETGNVLWEEAAEGKCTISTTTHSRYFLSTTSLTNPSGIIEFRPVEAGGSYSIIKSRFFSYPEPLLKKIIHGRSEAVNYETFDIDPGTGHRRKIHAFVLIPDDFPSNPADRKAIITAFYGGENRYQIDYQIFLQAGFIIMSPAVRGSWGFGAEYYGLNDKDLGGNEIIDLIYAGRYLAKRFDLREEQVGLEGGSHGGYCAMRGLTFPPGVNGRNETFRWGFAISSYGISNIIDYYRTCNIPDWVLQKAGDPVTEAEKLMDRSPIQHAHRATGPLLLVHGENDNRVPVDQSRQMAAAMKAAKKPYRYLEIAGQGHGWIGLSENLRFFKEVFSFMEMIP